MTSYVPVHRLKQATNIPKLEQILNEYTHFTVDDHDVDQALSGLKTAVGFNTALETFLGGFWIIDVGDHYESRNFQFSTNWRQTVDEIKKAMNRQNEDSILRINLGVEIKKGDIVPTEQTKCILEAEIPESAVVYLLNNRNVRSQPACFALHKHFECLSAIDIYTTVDIHMIMRKRKYDNVRSVIDKYHSLVRNVYHVVDEFDTNFPYTLDKFDTKILGEIASKIDLGIKGPCFIHKISELKLYKNSLVNSILGEIAEQLSSKFQEELKNRISLTLSHSLNIVSFDIEKDFNRLFQFLYDVVTLSLKEVFRTIIDALFNVVYAVFVYFVTVDINDIHWRHKIANEVYDKIKCHRQKIIDSVQAKLQHVTKHFQKDLDKLNEIKRIRRSFTYRPERVTYQQFREWKWAVERATTMENAIKKVDDKSIVYFGERDSEFTISVRCSKSTLKGIDFIKQEFPDADIKSIKEATEESRVIDEYIEKKQLYPKAEQVENVQNVIKAEGKHFFKKHSNLNLISISRVKGEGFTLDPSWTPTEQLCIVFFCSSKGVIPLGEVKFPSSLRGYPVDVREGYLFACHSREVNTVLRIGCSIGRQNMNSVGSIGPFVRQRGNQSEHGFLTCRHVLFGEDDRFSSSYNTNIVVVQPSDVDSLEEQMRNCGNVKADDMSVDAAYVEITHRKPNSNSFPSDQEGGLGNTIPVLEVQDQLIFDDELVKFGRTTGYTKTVYRYDIYFLGKFEFNYAGKRESRQGIVQYTIEDICAIPNKDNSEQKAKRFFCCGDSGSALFLKKQGKFYVLGMAIGSSHETSHETPQEEPEFNEKCFFVPIKNILEKLNLELICSNSLDNGTEMNEEEIMEP